MKYWLIFWLDAGPNHPHFDTIPVQHLVVNHVSAS